MAGEYANVKFLRGTQASLTTLLNGSGNRFTKGAFYLTSDTNRLYFAQSETNCVPLNQFIRNVSQVSELPGNTDPNVQPGDYYYVTTGNILCIRNGNNDGWTQINHVEDTNDYLAAAAFTASASNGTATVSESFTNYNKDGGASDKTVSAATFQIEGTHGLDVSASGSKVTIEGDTYTIDGTAGVQAWNSGKAYAVGDLVSSGGAVYRCKTAVAAANNNSTFAAIESNFEAENAAITLNSANGQASSGFVLKKGSNIQIAQTGNQITLSSSYTDYNLGGPNAKFDITDKASNGFTFTVTDSSGSNQVTDDFDPTITVGNQTTSTIHFNNGDATLPVYTKTEVDEILNGLNGITYKGTIGQSGGATVSALPTSNVKIGDMYMALENDTTGYGGHPTRQGDLFIAQGTESASTGYITGTVNWTFIPAGNDEATSNTTYVGVADATNHTLELQTDDTSHTGVAKIDLDAGTNISLTSSTTGSGIGLKTTIAHGAAGTGSAVTATPDTAASNVLNVTAVTGVSADSNGHVTGVTTKSFGIKDTLFEIDGAVAGITNGVKVTNTVQDTSGGNQSTSVVGITSQSLAVAAGTVGSGEDARLTVELEWGTF